VAFDEMADAAEVRNDEAIKARPHPAAVEGEIVHAILDRLFKALAVRGLPALGTPSFREALAEVDVEQDCRGSWFRPASILPTEGGAISSCSRAISCSPWSTLPARRARWRYWPPSFAKPSKTLLPKAQTRRHGHRRHPLAVAQNPPLRAAAVEQADDLVEDLSGEAARPLLRGGVEHDEDLAEESSRSALRRLGEHLVRVGLVAPAMLQSHAAQKVSRRPAVSPQRLARRSAGCTRRQSKGVQAHRRSLSFHRCTSLHVVSCKAAYCTAMQSGWGWLQSSNAAIH